MNYRQTRHAYLNCERRIFPGTGNFDIPEMYPSYIDFEEPPEMLGFNHAKGEDFPELKVLHFYVDDYQFDRVWNNPERYLDLLRKFKAVLQPDFSLYTDFPYAVNLFNHYRKQWLGAYWQENGIEVIPTICWALDNSFEYCLDGVPRESTVSISCVGCNKSEQIRKEYWEEFMKVVDILRPTQILLYTGMSPVEAPEIEGTEIIKVQNDNLYRAEYTKNLLKVMEVI